MTTTDMAGRNLDAVEWPDGRAFAFSVFDDPDGQRLGAGREVYAFLRDLGLRTTKGVWPLAPERPVPDSGSHCEDPEYRAWVLDLARSGFEIGFHGSTLHTSPREDTRRGLNAFRDLLGHDPRTMSNHYNCSEGIYFGDRRLSGWRRVAYNVLTLGRNRRRFHGHEEGHPLFWGDLCRKRVRYVRNFVFGKIDTLGACPFMPYHDPDRPWVNAWFASSEGNVCSSFVRQLSEPRQDRLEASGGACIMYTHFGRGFYDGRRLDPRFCALMERLASKNGWFVPVSTLLDHIVAQRGLRTLTRQERARLESRWLVQKLRTGSR